MATRRYSTAAEIALYYTRQTAYQPECKQLSVQVRKELLSKLEQVILARRKDIQEALFQDLGKAALESDYAEIFAVISELRFIQKKLGRWAAPTAVANNLLFFGAKAYIQSEPKGRTLIISPWNYPFQLPLVHLAASVAAGNTVILKPSEFSEHTNRILAEIIAEVFDPQHVAVVEGAVEETTQLLALRFDHIHFTGSPAVGKIVMQQAAKNLCGVTLELGGKSPVFIDRQTDLSKTCKNIIWAKFLNAGQTCIAPDYALVDSSLKEAFLAQLKEALITAFGTDPKLSKDYARIINGRQLTRLKTILEEELAQGTQLICGGEVLEEQRYMAPTVVIPTRLDRRLMQDELFGPILPVIFYQDLAEALQIVNEREKPLSCYIFSDNKKYVEQVIKHTSAGSTCINDAVIQIMHPNLPFAGVNNSGIGQSLGKFGFQDFSHQRAILQSSPWVRMSSFFWFPYKERTKKLVNLLIKWF